MDQVDTECQVKPLGPNDLCDFNPEFAVICSFIEQFGEKIDLELDIERLRQSIEDQENIDESLIDIHVKLIKKVRRYFVRDQWEKALTRFAAEYSYEDAYDIERLGYMKTRPSLKLELLRRLFDAQFEFDQKFKSLINNTEADKLRLIPTGRDLSGNTYWHNTDREGNFRVFREEPLDYKSWKVVCKTRNELGELIETLESNKDVKLKGEPKFEPYNPLPEIFPDLFVTETNSVTSLTASKPTRSKYSRKGRNRGHTKKTNKLVFLKEEDEEKTNQDLDEQHKSHDRNDKTNSNLPDAKPLSRPNLDNGSLEYQVRDTVESLLSRVVSSIDYFLFKPLTRNFTDSVKQEKSDDFDKYCVAQTKPKPPQKKRQKRERPTVEELPRRSSSRIQLLQQKKEQEELQKIVELTKKIDDSPTAISNIPIDDACSRENGRKHSDTSKPRRNRSEKQRWRDNNGKKNRSWDKDDSDLSSTSSPTQSDDDRLSEDDPTFTVQNDDQDDEFACEDEETNLEPVIIKRARTARQSIAPNDETNLETSSILEEDKPCGRCDKSNDPDCILLCDMCDDGYHLACCIPPLMVVPDGNWYCPPCEHKTLLITLNQILAAITKIHEAKERERMKRERLRATAAARRQGAREERERDEILTEKRQRDFLHELNEPVALQQLDEDIDHENQYRFPREKLVASKSKKISKKKKSKRRRKSYNDDDDFIERPRQTHSRRLLDTDEETDDQDFSEKSSSAESYKSDKPKTRRARACVSYKFKEYDELIKSAILGDSGDDKVSDANDSEPETCNYGRGKDMATIEALAYQQENGLLGQPAVEATTTIPKSRSYSRKKSRRLNDLDAESEIDDATSDESFQASSATEAEDDEEDVTEMDSDEDESSFDEIVLATKRSGSSSRLKRNTWKKKKKKIYYESDESSEFETTTRRAAAKQISYKESTDEDDFSAKTNQANYKESTDDEDFMVAAKQVNFDESTDEEDFSDGTKKDEIAIAPAPFYGDDEVRSPTDRARTW